MAAFTGCRILYAERHTESVTCAAKFALIHLFHNPAFVRIAGWHDIVMTIIAAIPLFTVWFVTELHISGIGRKLVTNRFRG